MLKVQFSFGQYAEYRSAYVDVNRLVHTVSLELGDGKHSVTSEPFEIGVVHRFEGRRLLGQLTFQYAYSEAARVITVCGTDFDSSEAMCLITYPEGSSEHCYQRAAEASGFAADDLLSNPHWNYCTPLTPGLQDVLRRMAREANEALIRALENQPGLIVEVRRYPPQMLAEDYHRLLTVYRNGEFVGLHEPGRELGDRDVVYTIESTFGGTVKFSPNEAFANVIGSTHDPKIAGLSWIALWANQFGVDPTICTSFQFNGFNCGSSLVGGHVVIGTVAKKVPMGSNSVYILPICVQHNNNDNVYMEALKYHNGIWLKNYLGS